MAWMFFSLVQEGRGAGLVIVPSSERVLYCFSSGRGARGTGAMSERKR